MKVLGQHAAAVYQAQLAELLATLEYQNTHLLKALEINRMIGAAAGDADAAVQTALRGSVRIV